ncbi:MAG TPA: 3-deoxy-D-manno-octulosonate 8-phosphate phosphatase, partial [Candidatus Kapabacteria bacterium]|nr:3-deoxy-D-manno-octulosonate 8-phosphate phosphatase [Candidatus Kapabacteria bacterium]
MKELTQTEIEQRAKRIRLVLTDVDGVLTDTGVYYSARGEELKRFSIRDGMGMEILREHGVETAMMTRETSGTVESRSKKLALPYLYLGIFDKRAFLPQLMTETGFTMPELAYIGDDINDVDIIETIGEHGLTACPADAMPVVASIAHYHAKAPGGHGAFRDFAEWILYHR